MIIKGYKSVAELINKKKYPVNVPSNIETPQIYLWSDNTVSTQLYEPMFHTLLPSKRTINDLIDFCFNKIDFQLHVDNEGRHPIFEIEWATRTYLEEARILEQRLIGRTDIQAQEIKIYIFKAKNAYKYFDRMLQKTIHKARLQDTRIHEVDRLIARLKGIVI
jgi:hypothetical protein